MDLLAQFELPGNKGKKIELYCGDLTQIPQALAVDLLVVSAFPNDYVPTQNSLIGALHRRGVSVASLARMKELDLRTGFSCWLSRRVGPKETFGFGRILCFEPTRARGAKTAPEYVGDIFRSLLPIVFDQPDKEAVRAIAMPLVTAGDQNFPIDLVMTQILVAGEQWLSRIPLDVIRVVEFDRKRALLAHTAFENFLRSHQKEVPPFNAKAASQGPGKRYDAFISYSHVDTELVDKLIGLLQAKGLKLFVDRLELQPSSAWQAEIFSAIDDCEKIVTVYSPEYLVSKVCQEELQMALFRHREEGGVLVPLYLRSAELPTFLKIRQYIDAREGTDAHIQAVLPTLLDTLKVRQVAGAAVPGSGPAPLSGA